MSGTLWVVATPIGNLGDLTHRAEDVLRRVPHVAAEDTRRTRGLLSHLGREGAHLVRLDAHASGETLSYVVGLAKGGEDVALVTDAGTPAVSDPGAALVALAVEEGVPVVPLPGPSAPLAALAASGFPGSCFRFVAFLPRSGRERDEALDRVAQDPDVVLFFEAANRLQATLQDLAARVPERRVVVSRELTKLHEEHVRGTLAELATREEWLGEITVVLGPWERPAEDASEADVEELLRAALRAGKSTKEAAEDVARLTGSSKRELYQRALGLK